MLSLRPPARASGRQRQHKRLKDRETVAAGLPKGFGAGSAVIAAAAGISSTRLAPAAGPRPPVFHSLRRMVSGPDGTGSVTMGLVSKDPGGGRRWRTSPSRRPRPLVWSSSPGP